MHTEKTLNMYMFYKLKTSNKTLCICIIIKKTHTLNLIIAKDFSFKKVK